MTTAARSLRCLYYPYSRPLSVLTLKKAVLLFDEIVVADLQPWFIRQALNCVNQNATAAPDDFDYLAERGVIRVISPEPVIAKYDVFLTNAVVNDLRDDDFCAVAVKEDTTVWNVLSARLPPSFFGAFYPGEGKFAEAITLQALFQAGNDFEKVPTPLRKFAEFRWKRYASSQLWPTFLSQYRFVVGGNPFMELSTYEIPFLQASSLRINEALIIAADNELIPFTDSIVHDRLLKLKVNRTLASLATDGALRERLEVSLPSLPLQHLSLAVLDRLVPEKELAKRTLSELLEYRDANVGSLRRLRLALEGFAASVDPAAPDYYVKYRKSWRRKSYLKSRRLRAN